MTKVGIAGGGISGLACAHYLKKAGAEVVVFDPTPGGLIGSVTIDNCILETGPESWLASKPWAEQLLREIGLGDQITGSNDARRRTYILKESLFEVLPEGLQLVVPTRPWPVLQSRLLGWGTKLRMAAEIFRNPKTLPDRSVAAFVGDHFGQEAVEYLAEPLLAGVYGGSTESLSAVSVLPKFVEHEQRYGSVVVGALREKKPVSSEPVFKSLRSGMGSFVRALESQTTIVRARVESIRPGGDGEARWHAFADGAWHEFDQLVLCCGANNAAPLLGPVDPVAADLLGSIAHTSSAIWTMGYRREDVPHPLDAFGFLIPKGERNAIMACTWVATKWLGRVPDDKAVLRCFSTDLAVTKEAIQADLKRLMAVTAEPIFAVKHECPDAMPQYTVGHTIRIGELEARIDDIPGLYLAGNAYHGIGIPDCVRSGKQAAEAITLSRL
ncbi:MAG TPA: protoporphyrinogen oxidase [Bryobacteraceae bacterium]|nr:protoporphyrinogen oxidase [Bryobacteraceae bacterium]